MFDLQILERTSEALTTGAPLRMKSAVEDVMISHTGGGLQRCLQLNKEGVFELHEVE